MIASKICRHGGVLSQFLADSIELGPTQKRQPPVRRGLRHVEPERVARIGADL
jgi:hypothetical protein